MGLSKRVLSTAAICCICYILLAVLVALSFSGKIFTSSLLICVMTNSITALYSRTFSGKKSLVCMAILAFAVNTLFLILRITGVYPPQGEYPSDGELVGAIILIVFSFVWILYGMKALRQTQSRH